MQGLFFPSSEHYGPLVNDDLLPTLMGRLMAETRVPHDRHVTANMAYRELYLLYASGSLIGQSIFYLVSTT